MNKKPIFKRKTWAGDVCIATIGATWNLILAWWLCSLYSSTKLLFLKVSLALLLSVILAGAAIWIVGLLRTVFRVRSYDDVW
ncbi:MAG: hypothetical protein JNK90_05460 [Planctomycetaceae bacterium]|nr:hypothetical protein [Planctomycetaceae bacterium]